MKYGSYYQIAHKETNEILSYMGETKFYSLDKAQEAMSDFENQEISAYESMRKELHTAFKLSWQSIRPLDSKFVDSIFENYESRLQPKDYRIVERKGYFF